MLIFKKFSCVLVAFLLALFILSATASAITVDGALGVVEWKGSEMFIVFESGSSSNCYIDFAMMKVKIDSDEQAVYLGFQATQDKAHALVAGNALAGVRINLKDEDYVVCSLSGVSEYDINSYDIGSKIVIGANNDFTVEVKIGYKYGIPEKALPGIQIVDGDGNPSNYYNWPVVPTTEATTTEKATTTKKETTTKETTTKAPTTKKETTTKVTTTKAPTTVKVPATTKAPTTAKTPTTTKAPATKKETTIETTKAKATTAKATTVKEMTTQEAATITKILQNATEATYPATVFSEEAQTSDAIVTSASQPAQWQSAQTEPNGTTYLYETTEAVANTTGISKSKQIAAIAVAVLLIAIAICLCVFAGAPKKTVKPGEKKEDPENEFDDF